MAHVRQQLRHALLRDLVRRVARPRLSAAWWTAVRRASSLHEADIQKELDRRKPGSSRHVTQRRESDTVEILSGVFEGRTTGTAIGFLVRNEDQRSKDYSAIAQKFRPGHADYTYCRSTACAIRAAAGALRRARPWCAWPPARSRRSG